MSIIFLRIDNAPEYVAGQFESYCKENGISFEKIVPDASQSNGLAERANWTLASMARAMLIDGDMPNWFWPYAVLAAAHIKCRVPHSALPPHTTPFEMVFHRKLDLSHLRPFGCKVTCRRLNSDDLTKFEPRGEEGRFLGYARDSKGYLIWFPHRRSVLVRRDVVFHDVPAVVSPPRIQSSDLLDMWDDVPQHPNTQFGSRFFRNDWEPDHGYVPYSFLIIPYQSFRRNATIPDGATILPDEAPTIPDEGAILPDEAPDAYACHILP